MSLSDTATLADASEAFLRHRLLALPVVDGQGRLLGTIDIKANQPGPWGSFRDRSPGCSPTSRVASPAPS